MSAQDAVTRLNAALEGRYRIERQLGEGGMATVYLTDDLRHDRKVALKVLKPELAAVVGAERFLAEIKTTANLQHPHILPLFDSGEADSFLFYVMPYVEGESLRERLDREHQLPVDEAVQIAKDVAGALQAAHERGVIHRDIKPANILLSKGEPLVSDFGIALAVSAGGTGRLTETGLSLGTPHYMSPEQATGDLSIGAATDVYALGCVLYEMLVGEPPYTGSTPQAILGKIIQAKPISAAETRRSVPANVDAAIRRALEKVPADRFTSARDLGTALTDRAFRHGGADSMSTQVARPARSNAWVSALSASTLLLAAALTWSLLRPAAPLATDRRVLSTEGWAEPGFTVYGAVTALAPDGSSMIVPLGDGQLGLKMRGPADVTPIPGTQRAHDVVYSPDSRSIAYGLDGNLVVRPLGGGAAVTVAEDAQQVNRLGLAWLEDGTILYEAQGEQSLRIAQIPEAGGEPRVVLTEGDGEWWIAGLPEGRGALVVLVGGQLVVLDLRDLTTEAIAEGVLRAWYVDPGYVVYVNTDGAVFAQPFDARALHVTGDPVPLFEGVRTGSNWADMRLATDGTLLYLEGSSLTSGRPRRLVQYDLDGNREVLPLPPRDLESVGWSPDGHTVAFVSQDQIYTYDVRLNSPPRQITFEAVNQYPAFSSDGTRIVFRSRADGNAPWSLFVRDLTSSAPARLILSAEGGPAATQWPSDALMVGDVGVSGGRDLWTLDLSAGDEPTLEPYLTGGGGVVFQRPIVSPDGTLVAYLSNESGEQETYIRSFPEPGERTIVSSGGGVPLAWAPDGHTLYYVRSANTPVLAAHLQVDPVPVVVGTDTLFDIGNSNAPMPGGALNPRGDRFILAELVGSGDDVATGASARLILVEHFFTELCERVGGC